MSEKIYKSFTGRWNQSEYMTVDASSLDVAIDVMSKAKGKDPLTVVRWKDDIIVATEDLTTVTIKTYIKWIGSDKIEPPYGKVYPSEFKIPPGDVAIVTAVPDNERITFKGFQNESGEYVEYSPEYAFKAKTDTVLYAVFAENFSPANYTFDPNSFTISMDNVISLNTTSEIIDDPHKIPTSQAVFNEMEKKIESITLNGRDVTVFNKEARIDLTQDYLYEDEDIDFAELF
jgi:hypothetical protein